MRDIERDGEIREIYIQRERIREPVLSKPNPNAFPKCGNYRETEKSKKIIMVLSIYLYFHHRFKSSLLNFLCNLFVFPFISLSTVIALSTFPLLFAFASEIQKDQQLSLSRQLEKRILSREQKNKQRGQELHISIAILKKFKF